jgi:uncharacterized membrane protein YhdT
MIPVIIFTIHIVGATAAFTKSYQEHGLTDGFMTLVFVGIIFSVGWTIAAFLVRFLAPHGGIHPWFDNDALSLTILTLFEAAFYLIYFREKKSANT